MKDTKPLATLIYKDEKGKIIVCTNLFYSIYVSWVIDEISKRGNDKLHDNRYSSLGSYNSIGYIPTVELYIH